MIQNSQIPIKVTTSGCEVIASGVVHLTEPEVKFEIANLTIRYKFIKDSEGPRFTGEVVNKEMVIRLHNFTSALGEGILKPLEIGKISGKSLLATCYVTTSEGDLREFHYTFMLRE
ncbi:DUF6864 domain-containing function [Alteromonas macleodii]|uniref:Uncharacterized protein n=1 Tax=Alteromonas macleodii TaxID=28108 RepID=A0A6T9Y5M5_ALTMA|nr:hypothetical protein [Alteromonas macleodii]CAB9493998.1 conserved protein of unknown function [Alteromonas macleodii]